MSEEQGKSQKSSEYDDGVPIFLLWDKYEQVAMHFNDLIMKIRTQALAAVATITTVAGILSKGAGDGNYHWNVIAAVFFFLNVFWVAIWILDFLYYDKLLTGAVRAVVELEQLTEKGETKIKQIRLSTYIEKAVAGEFITHDPTRACKLQFGRKMFYLLVLTALLIGLIFSVVNIR